MEEIFPEYSRRAEGENGKISTAVKQSCLPATVREDKYQVFPIKRGGFENRTHLMKQRAPSNVYPSSHPVGKSMREREGEERGG